MNLKVDRESGAAYISILNPEFLEGKVRSEPINADIIIDYTQDGKIYGIEILNLNLLDVRSISEVNEK